MKIYMPIIFLFVSLISFGQKKTINPLNISWDLAPWDAKISSDGQYILYNQGFNELILSDINGRVLMKTFHGKNATFAQNNGIIIFQLSNDSLGIYNISSKHVDYIPNCLQYHLLKSTQNEEILLYKTNENLIVKHLSSGGQFRYPSGGDYIINKQNSVLVVRNENEVIWIDLENRKQYKVYKGEKISRLTFNKQGSEIAFFDYKNTDPYSRKLLISNKLGTKEAKTYASGSILTQNQDLEISDEYLEFANSGNSLFVYTKYKKKIIQKKLGIASLNIWNYKDEFLQSAQLKGAGKPKAKFLSVYNKQSERFSILEMEDDNPNFISGDGIGNCLLFQTMRKPDSFYDGTKWLSIYLVESGTGRRTRIADKECDEFKIISLSPNSKYVVWFDKVKLCYFSYDVATGIKKNITQQLSKKIIDEPQLTNNRTYPWGVAGWTETNTSILIYDQYDIWLVDVTAKKEPINVTNHFGRSNQICFGLISHDKSTPISLTDTIYLSGYSSSTKENGIFKITLKGTKNPIGELLPYNFCVTRVSENGFVDFPYGSAPIKASEKNRFLVTRMSYNDAPNLFVTDDFMDYKRITGIQPQRKYNWLTAELFNLETDDGTKFQGILYKPENFDSSKKYPLIFNYYEKRSDELHQFLVPGLTTDNINIPSFVSKGYLVFVPDIYTTPILRGQGTVNTILASLRTLKKFYWIDSNRIGLQGHSYGGYQTIYLITHSNKFTVACEVAGSSNAVSSYGYIDGQGLHRGGFMETSLQGAPMGVNVTPWTNPEVYINASSVFLLGKVETPLLMMHCKKDGAVPFGQAIELYTGLKRADKQVWLLEYDNGEHEVQGEDAEDFTVRLHQFFDHYLMGTPPPKWMTKGIPAHYKGVWSGLELDDIGSCGPKCKVCNEFR